VGDSLMATVVARALRAKYDRVDALTLPGHREALLRVPDLDNVLTDDGQPEGELASMLSAERYDAAIVTWATLRTARVPQLANIPVRVGQARRLYSWRFTQRVVVRSEMGDVTTHWSQILLDYARAIGCDTADTAPKFVPTEEDNREADALLASLGLSSERFAIVHSTNAIAPRRGIWPTESWAALARAIHERFDARVLLSGVPADDEIVQRIAAQSGATSIAGKTSLGGFGALAQRALAFTGITTGSMHIAAAVGCPSVGIFPFQTDTPERWAPVGPHTAIVRATYPCRPGERKETCPDYACIAHLNIPQILAALEQLLGTMVR
jgi:heptosyltransferase II